VIDDYVIVMMLGASLFLGALGLAALLWGLKSGQFDDTTKFLDGALLDSEEALRDAVKLEKKREEILKKKEDRKNADESYRPPD